ncbi:MAG: FAD-dependent oxidoreductase [Nitrososphaeria archaeon]|nr:FAD-dependent oxidoreductase [Nitrososphaeria archaeon]NIN53347.1 FAD-dependent oxidoreductase [Nitrososphaeria archaeon]
MSGFDVIIVGAGILGLSTAYHLKVRNPEKRILLMDKEPAAGQGNTSKSAACFRNSYSSSTNIQLADSSIDFYSYVQNELGFNLGLKKIGYLFLLSNEQFRKSKLPKDIEMRILEREDLEKYLAVKTDLSGDEEAGVMRLENIEKGIFCSKAGYLSSENLVSFYEQEYRRLRGETLYNTRVDKLVLEIDSKIGIYHEPFLWQEKRIKGVSTNYGDFQADKVIMAAGTWSNTLLDSLGIDAHVKASTRQIFVVRAETEGLNHLMRTKGFSDFNCLPVTFLPTFHFLVKPDIEEENFWIVYPNHLGIALKLEEDPQPHENYFNYGLKPVLQQYFPQFEKARLFNMWAGQRECSTIDLLPYVFEEGGAVIINGAHGKGITQADSLGRVAAGIYEGDKKVELFRGRWFNVADLGVKERNVEREEFII